MNAPHASPADREASPGAVQADGAGPGRGAPNALGYGLAVGFGAVDGCGKLVMVSRSFSEIVGYSQGELLGLVPPFPFWAEEEAGLIAGAFREAIGSGHGAWEFTFKRKNGQRFPALVQMADRLEDGGQRLTMCTISDLTGLRRAQDELRRSEERYRAALDSMLDCFGIYSAVRDETGRIVDFLVEYVNASACAANRMAREVQVGRRLCEMLPAHRPSGLFDAYCAVVETGEPMDVPAFAYADHFGGEHLARWFDIRASRMGDGFAATWRDVTGRGCAEQALLARTQEKESLVAIASVLAQPAALGEKISRILEEMCRAAEAHSAVLRVLDGPRQELAVAGSSPMPPASIRPQAFPVSEGIGGQAFQTAGPVVANEYDTLPIRLAEAAAQGVRSVVALPVIAEGRVLGVIAVRSKERNHFTPERVRVLSAIAGGIGGLLANARLQDAVASDLARARTRLEAFRSAAGRLWLEEDPGATLQRLLQVARDLGGARYAALGMWDAAGRRVLWQHDGLTQEQASLIGAPPAGLGVLAQIRDGQKSLRVSDLSRHAGAHGFPPGHPPMRSLLGIPVRCRSGIVGALCLTEKVGAPEFTEDDERLLNLFGIVACVLLDSASLLGQVVLERKTLTAIQASMTEGLAVFDAAGRVVYFNRAASDYTGLPADTAVGMSIADLYQALARFVEPPEAAETLMRILREGALTRVSSRVRFTSTGKDIRLGLFPIPVGSGPR